MSRWLSIDPGEMTGWALWDDKELLDAGQEELIPFIDQVAAGAAIGPTTHYNESQFKYVKRFVVEDFVLYPWEMKEGNLDFDEVRTARGIGALQFIARAAGLGFTLQPATIKEPSEAAGAKELFQHPLYENRHANDAIRHGWYYIVTTMLGQKVELPGGGMGVVFDPKIIHG